MLRLEHRQAKYEAKAKELNKLTVTPEYVARCNDEAVRKAKELRQVRNTLVRIFANRLGK